MAIYAYCLLRLPEEEIWPILQGISGHPVFPLRCGKYTMLVSRLHRDFPFTPRSIVEHGQVIARAFDAHTILPMRFATFFDSEKQIGQLVRENRRELLEAFCRLRGKAEMRLKLLFPTAQGESEKVRKPPQKSRVSGSPHSNGAEERIDPRVQEIVEELAARVCEMFQPLEQQVSCRRTPSSALLVDCAHLIESNQVETYHRLSTLASEQVKECDLRISGPWPPYHFLPASVRLPAPAPPVLRMRPAMAMAGR